MTTIPSSSSVIESAPNAGFDRGARLRVVLLGAGSALLYGGWATWVNRADGAVRAGLIQALLSFAITTGQSALVEWLFTRNRRRSPGIGRVAATVAPTLAVVGATLVTVHLLAGTQRLAATIAPSMIMGFVFISIYALGLDRRSQHHVGSP